MNAPKTGRAIIPKPNTRNHFTNKLASFCQPPDSGRLSVTFRGHANFSEPDLERGVRVLAAALARLAA